MPAKGAHHTKQAIKKIKYWRHKQVIIHSDKAKRNMSKSHIGIKPSKEARYKMSLAKKGKPAWNKGLNKYININLARPMTEEHKNKISNAICKAWQDPIKRKRMSETNKSRSMQGYREDLGHYVRSAFEANYCRFLKWFGIKYEYETNKCVFKLNNGTNYICDFYLPELEQYVELKGYIRPDAQNKMDVFQQQYGSVKWTILMQDSAEWKKILINYSRLIPNWEYSKREKTIINKSNTLQLV